MQVLVPQFAVIPVLVGPLQTLLALLPVLLIALANALLALFRPKVMGRLIRLIWRQKLPLLLLASVLALGRVALSAAFRRRGTTVAAPQGREGHPMFRGGPARRGWVTDDPDPVTGGRNWRFASFGAKTYYASPVVVGDVVYAVSAEVSPFDQNGSGRIVCLEADTGELVWQGDVIGMRATFASPAVQGRYLVSGEGLHITDDARVLCLDSGTGALLWEYRTADHVESSPCIDGDRVVVGAGDEGGIYCFALEPNADGTPNMLWHKDGPAYRDAESSPVAHAGRIYVGLGAASKAVVCLDAKDGTELWQLPAPYPVFGSPSIADGVLYVAMGTGNFVQDAEALWAKELRRLEAAGADDATIAQRRRELAPAGLIWAVELQTGTRMWEFALPQTVLGAVAVAGDKLFFGCKDGYVYCLSTAGKLIGRWNAQAPIKTSPAVTDHHVYVVSGLGVLYALGVDDLRPVWEIPLGTASPAPGALFLSSPSIAHGRAYVGTPGAGLWCVGQAVRPREPVWAGRSGGPGESGRVDTNPLAARMEEAWWWPRRPGATRGNESFRITGPLGYLANVLYVPCRQGAQHGVAAVAVGSGGVPATRWFAASRYPVVTSPVARGNLLLFVDGAVGSDGRRLYAVARDSGALCWTCPIDAAASGEMLLANGRLLIVDKDAGLSCRVLDAGDRAATLPFQGERTGWNPSLQKKAQRKCGGQRHPDRMRCAITTMAGRDPGDIVWSVQHGHVVGSPDVEDGRVAIALGGSGEIVMLDAETGRTLWRRALPVPPAAGPVLRRNLVLLPTAEGVMAFALRDGLVRWARTDLGAIREPLVLGGEIVAALSTEKELFLFDVNTGETVKRISSVRAAPMFAGDDVYVCGVAGIQRIDVFGEQGVRDWLRLDKEMGSPMQPPLVADSRLYLALPHGLLCARPGGGGGRRTRSAERGRRKGI